MMIKLYKYYFLGLLINSIHGPYVIKQFSVKLVYKFRKKGNVTIKILFNFMIKEWLMVICVLNKLFKIYGVKSLINNNNFYFYIAFFFKDIAAMATVSAFIIKNNLYKYSKIYTAYKRLNVKNIFILPVLKKYKDVLILFSQLKFFFLIKILPQEKTICLIDKQQESRALALILKLLSINTMQNGIKYFIIYIYIIFLYFIFGEGNIFIQKKFIKERSLKKSNIEEHWLINNITREWCTSAKKKESLNVSDYDINNRYKFYLNNSFFLKIVDVILNYDGECVLLDGICKQVQRLANLYNCEKMLIAQYLTCLIIDLICITEDVLVEEIEHEKLYRMNCTMLAFILGQALYKGIIFLSILPIFPLNFIDFKQILKNSSLVPFPYSEVKDPYGCTFSLPFILQTDKELLVACTQIIDGSEFKLVKRYNEVEKIDVFWYSDIFDVCHFEVDSFKLNFGLMHERVKAFYIHKHQLTWKQKILVMEEGLMFCQIGSHFFLYTSNYLFEKVQMRRFRTFSNEFINFPVITDLGLLLKKYKSNKFILSDTKLKLFLSMCVRENRVISTRCISKSFIYFIPKRYFRVPRLPLPRQIVSWEPPQFFERRLLAHHNLERLRANQAIEDTPDNTIVRSVFEVISQTCGINDTSIKQMKWTITMSLEASMLVTSKPSSIEIGKDIKSYSSNYSGDEGLNKAHFTAKASLDDGMVVITTLTHSPTINVAGMRIANRLLDSKTDILGFPNKQWVAGVNLLIAKIDITTRLTKHNSYTVNNWLNDNLSHNISQVGENTKRDVLLGCVYKQPCVMVSTPAVRAIIREGIDSVKERFDQSNEKIEQVMVEKGHGNQLGSYAAAKGISSTELFRIIT